MSRYFDSYASPYPGEPAAGQALTLRQLNGLVRQVLKSQFDEPLWVQAEISELRVASNGHCYLELIEKDPSGRTPAAKARGIVWSRTWPGLRMRFEESTGQRLTAGIKVQALVTVEFSEVYGYSLTLLDVDPAYTLGDLARRRREILRRLEEEGVIDLNKELPLPPLLQRIAVVSSATAAGYGDFLRQLEENPYQLRFRTELFPALMQGEGVEESILAALGAIADRSEEFDAVVIIRGGGAVSDLAGFDTYLLAAACAQFPLPLITGIGHERDDTVIDLVAHTRVKTPTAAAQFLITHQRAQLDRLAALARTLQEETRTLLHLHGEALRSAGERLTGGMPRFLARQEALLARLQAEATHRAGAILGRWRQQQAALSYAAGLRLHKRLEAEKSRLALLPPRLRQAAQQLLLRHGHALALIGQQAQAADPARILRRGYTLTLSGSRIVTSARQVTPGECLRTRFHDGTVASRVLPGEEQP